jgi:ABC-type transport system substrate-binding protein
VPAGAQAKPEGEMRFAFYVTISPAWFDPGDVTGFITPFWTLWALHDALVKTMPGKPMAPSLAESWTVSADLKTYDFKLRPGLKFHNGDPFTAEDVKFSFQRAKGYKILRDKVREIEVVSPLRVRIHLHEPCGDRPASGTVPDRWHRAGGVMSANDPARHYPGQYFSCDARNAEGDRRLCPLHEQAPTALRRILAALDEDVTPVELVDQIRLLAMRALGVGPP